MQETNIGWTDFSANLLKYRNDKGEIVWACVHASEGCRFCYSEALAKRWGRGEAFTAGNMKGLTPFFDQKEARQILNSRKIAGKKVFVDDMTDLFGEWVTDEIIDQHFAAFALRPDVTFQVLTKRAERMRDYLNHQDCKLRVIDQICYYVRDDKDLRARMNAAAQVPASFTNQWPLLNVHVGVSAEDQKTFDERWSYLRTADAAVRWVSIEPLLKPVDAQTALYEYLDEWVWPDGVVIGGESGHRFREMPLREAVDLAKQFHFAGVAVYVKQDSGPRPGMQGRIPDEIWAMKQWPVASKVSQA